MTGIDRTTTLQGNAYCTNKINTTWSLNPGLWTLGFCFSKQLLSGPPHLHIQRLTFLSRKKGTAILVKFGHCPGVSLSPFLIHMGQLLWLQRQPWGQAVLLSLFCHRMKASLWLLKDLVSIEYSYWALHLYNKKIGCCKLTSLFGRKW